MTVAFGFIDRRFNPKNKEMTVVSIITGNSNSGSACIEELFAKYDSQVKVRGVFRTEEKAEPFRKKYPKLDVVTGVDASRPESLVSAFKGADSALIVHPLDAATHDFAKDAQLSLNMINAAFENGVKYIVYVGSFTAEPPFDKTIIASRFKPSEALLQKLHDEKGLKFTVLRGGNFMENFRYNFKSIKESSSFSHFDIYGALVYTKDIGKCGAHCLATGSEKHDGKFYNMNGPEVLGAHDLARIVSKVVGREVKVNVPPKEALKAMPPPIAELYEIVGRVGKDGVPQDNDIQRLLGESSTFEQFLTDNIDKIK